MNKTLFVLDKSLKKEHSFRITSVAYADNHRDAPHLLTIALSKLESISTILVYKWRTLLDLEVGGNEMFTRE